MNNLIGFIGAMALQFMFVVLYIGMVLSIKYLISRSLPVMRGYLDQIRDLVHGTSHLDSTSQHPG